MSSTFSTTQIGSDPSEQVFNGRPDELSLQLADIGLVFSVSSIKGLGFEAGVADAMAVTENNLLFDFPAEKFPILASHAAAIRVAADGKFHILYAYLETPIGQLMFADSEDVGEELIRFGENYAEILCALSPDDLTDSKRDSEPIDLH